jgi:Tol biopolymer transport system component
MIFQLRKSVINNPASDTLPVWSPDGQKIAFLSDRGDAFRRCVMNIDGTDEQLLADIKVYDADIEVPFILLRGT